jgi:hypothetical protein
MVERCVCGIGSRGQATLLWRQRDNGYDEGEVILAVGPIAFSIVDFEAWVWGGRIFFWRSISEMGID